MAKSRTAAVQTVETPPVEEVVKTVTTTPEANGTHKPDIANRDKGKYRQAAQKDLAAKGVNAPTAQQVADEINTYPGVQATTWIADAAYVERSWKTEGKKSGAKRTTRTPNSEPDLFTPPPAPKEPSLTDLFIVKDALEGQDAAALKSAIPLVSALAEKVGGLANLTQCLTALERLSG